ncbi:protein of unknown function [Moritella yayanosii]|uniref:Uncharacterized protein n=1 Tax=Moritella yayanosii TaxID=69539 RepID=A0A330LV73_9GAMM|nr:protein of unknown function [Moritella yayanosii]
MIGITLLAQHKVLPMALAAGYLELTVYSL